MFEGYPLGGVFMSIFWFMLLFAWIWLLIMIVADIFRDHEMSGWGKAAWCVFLIVVPWLGALVYLIARGRSMNERTLAEAERQQAGFDSYVKTVAASSTSTADELVKLADLRDRGAISDSDYEQAKAKVLGASVPAQAPAPAVAPPRVAP